MPYQYKTEPFKHQAERFDATRELASYALFWEQGCGKTKPTIDTAAYLYEKGEIDAVIVIAPNGVHRNWISDEIPAHMPERVMCKTMAMFFDTNKAATKETQTNLARLLKHKGLAILTISYDGLCTAKTSPSKPDKGRDFAGKFMRQRRCLMVVDEAHYAKNPEAIRTRTLMKASKFAPYRRILTGTPVAQGPFDVYSQVQLLDEDFWTKNGISSFSGFKTQFGNWELKPWGPNGRSIAVCTSYKNLDKLQKLLAKIGHRLTKEEAELNLPPKIYSKRYVELTPEQRRAYQALKEELMVVLDSGEIAEAPLAIVQLLRFQQIVCGYVGTTDGTLVRIPSKIASNPRINVLEDLDATTNSQGIIWARFREDINQLMELLGDKAVRYDGGVDADGRVRAKEAFQRGDKKWFVGNQAAGATGLTLVQAKTVIYYSNSFRLVDRLQSEDRAHRIGQKDSVQYIDLIAEGTVDERLVDSLRNKYDIATAITGDQLKDWI